MSTTGEGHTTFVIGGRAYPALSVGEHDGQPFARLPLESGLVVESYGWAGSDEVSLFLVEAGDGEPDLCWSGVVAGEEAVTTIAEWSRWTKAVAHRWQREHGLTDSP